MTWYEHLILGLVVFHSGWLHSTLYRVGRRAREQDLRIKMYMNLLYGRYGKMGEAP